MSAFFSTGHAEDAGALALGGAPARPDEILMAAEEEAAGGTEREVMARRVACMCGLLQTVTAQAPDIAEVRDRVVVLAAEACPQLIPWERLWHGRAEKADLGAVRGRLMESGLEWDRAAGEQLLRLLTRSGWSDYEVGRRTLCLLYAFTPDLALRPPMARSLGTIGTALGLTATNKRSAVSAAIMAVVGELVQSMQRTSRPVSPVKLWFQKNPEVGKKLRRSMTGKRNRAPRAAGGSVGGG